ncbi:MAG: 4Fe-4S binding protein [Candidatus Aenigmarchaeota archaeon]|nr:4Fe-4S binding protein [Candidatus Aenigmarchaeota archaeon]
MVLKIDKNKCLSCAGCVSICPKDALTLKNMVLEVDENKCIECAICTRFCPVRALRLTTNL